MEKNRLCPPNRLPDVPIDWIRGTLIDLTAERAWSGEPDLAEWLESTRLNIGRGLRRRIGQAGVQGSAGVQGAVQVQADAQVQDAGQRFARNVRPGLASLAHLLDSHG